VQRLIGAQYERAQHLLEGHRAVLEELATQLLAKETLDGAVVRQALTAMGAAPAVAGSTPSSR
jgi:ATP-dependent Zn protease